MMSLLGQQYRSKKKVDRLLNNYASIKNVEIPATLDLKKMPPELKLDSCIESQKRNSKCETL